MSLRDLTRIPSSSLVIRRRNKNNDSLVYGSFRAIIIVLLRYKIEHIIFISSGGTIYGENYTGLPVTEDHPLNAQNAYGFGSWCLIV